MKKIILLFTFLFIAAISNAQFTVEDYDGVPIFDGDVRTFNSTNASVATLKFWIFNQNANDDILMKIKLESITNGDGTFYQFCFGELCIFDVQEGTTYPVPDVNHNPQGVIVIPAGGTNPPENKFQNENPGDGTNYPVDYVWRFFQVDENDNEIGNPITFTYRFDPNLSVTDFENNLGVTIQNTVATDLLTVSSINPLNFEILNINGQLMDFSRIGSGINNINVSNLNSGVYFIRFANENGNSTTMKFVIK